jgi:hypothetical protein
MFKLIGAMKASSTGPAARTECRMDGSVRQIHEMIRERVRAGLARAREEGTKLGRKRRDSARTKDRLIVSLVDPQCARPYHRTWGRQAFAICLGLAKLRRDHCTPYI